MGHRESLRTKNKQQQNTLQAESLSTHRMALTYWDGPVSEVLESCPGQQRPRMDRNLYLMKDKLRFNSPSEPVQRWPSDEFVILATSGVKKHVQLYI